MIKPCPFCGSTYVNVKNVYNKMRVQCYTCEAYGSKKPTAEEAAKAWNAVSDRLVTLLEERNEARNLARRFYHCSERKKQC